MHLSIKTPTPTPPPPPPPRAKVGIWLDIITNLSKLPRSVSILGEIFLERGANLESRAAHTHPKNTQVSPPGRTYDERNVKDIWS